MMEEIAKYGTPQQSASMPIGRSQMPQDGKLFC
jgi:hypothetical protein